MGTGMKRQIRVLGAGCSNCTKTYQRIAELAESSGAEIDLQKVEDLAEIMSYRLITLPGVVVDGELVHMGGVPDRKKIGGWLGVAVQSSRGDGVGGGLAMSQNAKAKVNAHYRIAVLLGVALAVFAVLMLRPGVHESKPSAPSSVAAGAALGG